MLPAYWAHNGGGHITRTISWLASDPPFLGEAACHCDVQRRWPCGNQSGEAERGSGIGLKLFGFIPDSAFTFIPDHCSESSRIAVRIHPGIAFTLPRNPQGGHRGLQKRLVNDFPYAIRWLVGFVASPVGRAQNLSR